MHQVKVLVIEESDEISAYIGKLSHSLGFGLIRCCRNIGDAKRIMQKECPAVCLIGAPLEYNEEDSKIAYELFIRQIICIYMIEYLDVSMIAHMKKVKPWSYLYKPLREMDVLANLELAFRHHTEFRNRQSVIVIPAGRAKKVLPLAHVLSVKANGNYTEIMTKDRKFVLRKNLKDFEKSLPLAHPLLRIHKSHMVNKTHILSFNQHKIQLSNYDEIPVGRTFAKKVNTTAAVGFLSGNSF